MSARAAQADLVRWGRRLGRSGSQPEDGWASSADVDVQETHEPGAWTVTLSDVRDPPSAQAWNVLSSPGWSWSVEPVAHDGWMGTTGDSPSVLHLHVPVQTESTSLTVRCRWARTSPRPLLVHLHVPAEHTVIWSDETAPTPWQRTARVWHVAEGARVRISNPVVAHGDGAAWWDDAWSLAPGAQVTWLDQLGDTIDVRRRTQVGLQAGAIWKMASVGWLLPQRWHDHAMDVQHHGERSESHLHHRTVLLDRAQRRLTSCVSVDPRAVGGFTAQTMQHWPLSEQVTLTASPQLAIGIGELRGATHGAAVGRFDPLVIQAMRARGVTLPVALRLMLEGALRDAMDRLDDGHPWWDAQRDALHHRLMQGHWIDAAQAFWDRAHTGSQERVR